MRPAYALDEIVNLVSATLLVLAALAYLVGRIRLLRIRGAENRMRAMDRLRLIDAGSDAWRYGLWFAIVMLVVIWLHDLFMLRFPASRSGRLVIDVTVMAMLVFLLVGRVLWVRHRRKHFFRRLERARRQLCPECHYSLAGHADGGQCPECGYAFSPLTLERDWTYIKTLARR